MNKAREASLKISPPQASKLRGYRFYECSVGPGDTMALEWDFDCLADYEEFLTLFFAAPENAEGLSQWPDSVSSTTEIWELKEKG